MKLATLLAAVASISAAVLAGEPASAEPFPSRTIRLVNPYPAGGATDIVARAIGQEMSKVLGQPVIVDNRSGAAGNVGAEVVAKAQPDGYTILLAPVNLFAVAPALYSNLSYNALKDLAPVIALTSSAFVLEVHPSVKANSVAELVALAKANPGKFTFASVGNGSMVHLQGEMFKQLAGIDLLHVPYRGSAPAVTDLLAGQVHMTFDNIPTAVPHFKSGALRPLAVTGPKRAPALPDVPTMSEAGVKGYEAVTWFGLAAPAGTPPEIINKLNEAAAKGAQAPAFMERMRELSFDIIGGSPSDMSKLIQGSVERWVPVVKASGAKID